MRASGLHLEREPDALVVEDRSGEGDHVLARRAEQHGASECIEIRVGPQWDRDGANLARFLDAALAF